MKTLIVKEFAYMYLNYTYTFFIFQDVILMKLEQVQRRMVLRDGLRIITRLGLRRLVYPASGLAELSTTSCRRTRLCKA